jgi:DNA-binding beta-propeller fold protein YncE
VHGISFPSCIDTLMADEKSRKQIRTKILIPILAVTLSVSIVIGFIYIYAINSPPKFIAEWGSVGLGSGQLSQPHGISIGSGYLYVADTGNNRIQKFDRNGKSILMWSSAGSNGIITPDGLAVDSNGHTYAADTRNNQIQKFYSNGTYIMSHGGAEYPFFKEPSGVALDFSDSYVYVTNSVNSIDIYYSNLTWIKTISSSLSSAQGVAVYKLGNVYVVDSGNNRIQKFTPLGGFKYTSPKTWGSAGNGKGQFEHPSGVAVDQSGNVYVVDSGNNRIQKSDSNGNFITMWGSGGSDKGEFNHPYGIAVDPSGTIYVTDLGNSRIELFSY